MEGSWRGVAWVAMVLAGCVLMLGASGCGDDESSAGGPNTVQTADPERTFAPLIELAADEPWWPMSARWFIERSIFGFAEDQGCPDRKIAIGHTLPELRTDEFNWIYPSGLGDGPDGNYFRNPHDAGCEITWGKTFYADQFTRPHDPGSRIEGIRAGEGYYLDLVDGARPGQGAAAPVYVERVDEGDDSVRLTYWVLFGMHGQPGESTAHEGDWERVDVLLRSAGDDAYEPLAVQAPPAAVALATSGEGDGADLEQIDWAKTRRVDGTHPVVTAARSTHTMAAAAPRERCSDCVELRAWRSLAPARDQPWYGFGGAWGAPGADDATTGPLGPHDEFSTIADKQRAPRG